MAGEVRTSRGNLTIPSAGRPEVRWRDVLGIGRLLHGRLRRTADVKPQGLREEVSVAKPDHLLFVEQTAEDALKAGAARLDKILATAYLERRKVVLFLAGGSNFTMLNYVDAEMLGSNVTLVMGDDRITHDPKESNAAQLKQTPFFKALERRINTPRGPKFIDTQLQEGESDEAFVVRYNQAVLQALKDNPLKVGVLGMGPDGHTAGIAAGMTPGIHGSTYYQLINERTQPDQVVVGYDTRGNLKPVMRATTTMTVIKDLDEAIVIATGEGKQQAMSRIFQPGNLAETPAKVITKIKGNMHLYTDRAAMPRPQSIAGLQTVV